MSEIRVTDIKGENGLDAVTLSKGASSVGIITATGFKVGTAISATDGAVSATRFHGSGANLTGINPGITNAQQFRLAANQTGSGSNGTVLTNWEEVDTDYQAIGSNWSQSSGVFSCSATGIYLCFWGLVVYNTNTGDAYDPNIRISTDSGSSYTTRSRAWAQITSSGGIARAHVQNQLMFDVANTGTFRLQFRQSQGNDIATGTNIAGSSTETLTNMMFIRLGDT